MVQTGSISFGRSSKTPVAGAFHEYVNKKTFAKGLAISLLILTPFLLFLENIEIFKEEGIYFLNKWDSFSYEELLVFIGVFLLGVFSVMILMIRTAHKHFNAVTGDVAGASNEITRMTILLLLIILI
ncbi:MAG: adenosylcobinamide-GDP ribazoletransferase, partial [Candidatus Wukongarchaeota archaeon]|nr:adenosylcobinamide-GDP ribazoletransferase [Candidatus Wukongarchaeota archaeon]